MRLALFLFLISLNSFAVRRNCEQILSSNQDSLFHDFWYTRAEGKPLLAKAEISLNIYVKIKNIQIIDNKGHIEIILPRYKKPNGQMADVVEFLNDKTRDQFKYYVLNVFRNTYYDREKPYIKSSNQKRYLESQRYIPGSVYRDELLNLTGVENERNDISLVFDHNVRINGFAILKNEKGGENFEPLDNSVRLYSSMGITHRSYAVSSSVSNKVFKHFREK
jgi:DNA-binding cell septation regulator SpoVG